MQKITARKTIAVLVYCLSGAFVGQVIFGDMPVINWSIGAFTGILADIIWSIE